MKRTFRNMDDIFTYMTLAEDFECIPAIDILREFEEDFEELMYEIALAEAGEWDDIEILTKEGKRITFH